jgi:hypothetical protein
MHSVVLSRAFEVNGVSLGDANAPHFILPRVCDVTFPNQTVAYEI